MCGNNKNSYKISQHPFTHTIYRLKEWNYNTRKYNRKFEEEERKNYLQ